MALLAPMFSLTAVYARTRTLSYQKQEWHSSPAIFETRATPSWNKQPTPERQITMALRPLPMNLHYKSLPTAIRDFRNNESRRIHEKPLDWLWASSNTRLVQDASELSSCQLMTRRAHLQIRARIHKLSILSSSNTTSGNKIIQTECEIKRQNWTSNVGKTVSFFKRLERNSSLIVPLILMRRKALKAEVNICINP